MKIVYEVTVTNEYGTSWKLNDKLHREDGPAVEYTNGYKAWWLNDERHREDGPAVIHEDGSKEWWLNGKEYFNDGYTKEIARRKNSCDGKIVEIDGKKYKLTEA